MQHIHTVLAILHPQTEFKLGVAPYIIIHGSAGLLRRQNQVYAKASSDLGHTDQFPHKIRFFPLKFRKLVDNNEKMRHGLPGLPVFIKARIGINVIDPILIKDPLTAEIFTFYRNHGTVHLISGKVGNLPQDMGKPRKQIPHTPALIVDNKETDIIRAEI